jgi:hypothetical protein
MRTLLVLCCLAVGLNAVDFKNFSYPWRAGVDGVPDKWEWIKADRDTTLVLKDGRHDSPTLWWESTTYGSLLGGSGQQAAVFLRYSTGGTANWGYLYIFSRAGNSPKLLAILRTGSRADGGLLNVAIQGHSLLLDFADTKRRIADCCSEGWVRVTYRWQRDHFVEVGKRRYGDVQVVRH